MNGTITNEINEFLEELAEGHKLAVEQPGDFTAEDFSRATGHGLKYSEYLLRGMLKQGEVVTVKVRRADGKIKTMYRKSQ